MRHSFPTREPDLSKIQKVLLVNLEKEDSLEVQKENCLSIIFNQFHSYQILELDEIIDGIELLFF